MATAHSARSCASFPLPPSSSRTMRPLRRVPRRLVMRVASPERAAAAEQEDVSSMQVKSEKISDIEKAAMLESVALDVLSPEEISAAKNTELDYLSMLRLIKLQQREQEKSAAERANQSEKSAAERANQSNLVSILSVATTFIISLLGFYLKE